MSSLGTYPVLNLGQSVSRDKVKDNHNDVLLRYSTGQTFIEISQNNSRF